MQKDWRSAKKNEWIKTDDRCVMQILREGIMGKVPYIGTITGTYRRDADLITGERMGNIYSLSGKTWYESMKDRKELTPREKIFVVHLLGGMDAITAYSRAFGGPIKNAKNKSSMLIRQERIQVAINEKIEDALTKHGLDAEVLIGRMNDFSMNGEAERTRVEATKELWKAAGIGQKEQVKTAVGLFHGFTSEAIDSVKRKELSNGKQSS